MEETKTLFDLGILGYPGDSILGLSHINPGKLNTQSTGKLLVELMELYSIPQVDIQNAVIALG